MLHGFGRYGLGAAHGWAWLTWAGPIALIVFWALFVVAMILLIVYLIRHGRGYAPDSTAMAILRERYAKGEIAKEEFEEKRKDLM
ncbi:MAG: SHOCT domain-containing protein [Spirochaetia bacterium]|jgi:putative membrane protein